MPDEPEEMEYKVTSWKYQRNSKNTKHKKEKEKEYRRNKEYRKEPIEHGNRFYGRHE